MRFIADGPIIPDSLLNKRDAGQVVFFCGASVSLPAGMPTFLKLTQYVIDKFNPPENSDIANTFEPWRNRLVPVTAKIPLDQIFNMIQNEYGHDLTNKHVTERLSISDDTSHRTTEHEIISRISANQDGIPQIVTTNFDRLFEMIPGAQDMKDQKYFVPPTFPDLRHDTVLPSGITYLHGRLGETTGGTQDYILSSSDFGRAYLAEGWATRFVRLLLQRYTVVMIGYQAEDPPIKYLLQGLNSVSALNKGKFFTFDRGSHEEIEAKWRDRGVTPISYGGEKDDHSALWDTLAAWAERADNPAAWRDSVVELAQAGARKLEPHQRGMVCHLVRSSMGAKLFADAKSIPPAEWICVFDRTCRVSASTPQGFELDDDPSQSARTGSNQAPDPDDLISWRHGDNGIPNRQYRLASPPVFKYERTVPRFRHLIHWVRNSAHDPVIAWWAARQYSLHPRLGKVLLRKIESAKDLPQNAVAAWKVILEYLEQDNHVTNEDGPPDMALFKIRRQIEKLGWTTSVLREFEKITDPLFMIKHRGGDVAVRPPSEPWSALQLDDIAKFDVDFQTQPDDPFDIPDDSLVSVYSILERNLIRGIERRLEVGITELRTPYYYRDKTARKSRRYYSGFWSYILWFVDILDRMVVSAPLILKSHVQLWPTEKRYGLDKLRFYTLNRYGIFEPDEIAAILDKTDQDAFWDYDSRWELLFLLRDRWNEFRTKDRNKIINRLLAGPDSNQDQKNKAALQESNTRRAALYVGWLLHANCKLPAPARKKYDKLTAIIPEWNAADIEVLTGSQEPTAGFVYMEDDPAVLADIPLDKIAEVALKNTGLQVENMTDYSPFQGLVKKDPEKAVRAIQLESGGKESYESLWKIILQVWPEEAPPDATWFLCEQLRILPHELMRKIRYELGMWLSGHLHKIANVDETFALEVFDDIVTGLLSGGEVDLQSTEQEIILAGENVQSCCTMDNASSAPMGHATMALMSILNNRKIPQGHQIPEEFESRFDRLLAAPGEGSGHTAIMLTAHINWLIEIVPRWVEKRILPCFKPEHPAVEPAWYGLFYSGQHMSLPLTIFAQIKSYYLRLFTLIDSWNWEDNVEQKAHQWVVIKCGKLLASDKTHDITFAEARQCIREMSNEGRGHVIRTLHDVRECNEDDWHSYVMQFISEAWPMEKRFQTEKTSAIWVSLLIDTGAHFPNVLEMIKPLLRPHNPHWFYGLEQTTVVEDYPKESLDLLYHVIPDELDSTPYDLGEVLNQLAEMIPALTNDHRYIRLQALVS